MKLQESASHRPLVAKSWPLIFETVCQPNVHTGCLVMITTRYLKPIKFKQL